MAVVLSVPTAARAAPEPEPAFRLVLSATDSSLTLSGPEDPIGVPESATVTGLLEVRDTRETGSGTSSLTLVVNELSGPGDVVIDVGGVPLAAAGDSVTLPSAGELAVGVTFAQAGDYRITFGASTPGVGLVAVSGDEAATRAAEATDTAPGLTAPALSVEFRVSAPVAEQPGEHRDEGVESDADADADADVEEAADADVAVTALSVTSEPSAVQTLSEGNVRLAYRLIDGELDLSLAVVEGGVPEWHSVADTIIQIPHQDVTWPGSAYTEGSLNWRRWETLIAAGQRPYRTAPTTALATAHVNTISLSWDASLISTDDLFGGVNRELRGVTSDSGGYLVTYTAATGNRQWDSREDAPATNTTSAPRTEWVTANASATGALAASPSPTGFLFSEPGIYCVSVGSLAYYPEDWQGTTRTIDTLTFAVGDVAPTASELCAQPTPESADEPANDYPDEGNVVIRSGDIRLASSLGEDGIEFRIADLSSAEQRTFDAEQVVLHLPEEDVAHPTDTPFISAANALQWTALYPSDSRYWRSDARFPNAWEPLQSNPIRFALDADASFTTTAQFVLGTVSGPGNVYAYTAQRDDNSFNGSLLQWSSDAPRDDSIRNRVADVTPGSGNAPAQRRGTATNGSAGWYGLGWMFSAPGMYCVEVTAASVRGGSEQVDGNTVLTFVVGDEIDPAAVTPCTDASDDGSGEGDEDAGVDGVHYITRGHTDIGLSWTDEGGIEFYASDQTTGDHYSLTEAVLIGNTPYNRGTVSTSGATLIGAMGSEYWAFHQASAFAGYTVWPGFSSLELGSNTITGSVSWTLQGVRGPGDVLLYTSQAVTGGTTNAVWFNSRWGLPMGRDADISHEHVNWAFTAPGVYCLNLQARVRDLEGVEHIADGPLTVAVGDEVRLSETTPCAGDEESDLPVGQLPEIVEADAEGAVVSAGQLALVPYLSEGGLRAATSVRGTLPAGERRFVDPETVIISGSSSQLTGSGNVWQIGPAHRWQNHYLDGEAIVGDATLSLGEVDGPGELWFTRFKYADQATGDIADIGTREGDPSSTRLWPGWDNDVQLRFTAAGVYCVPLTWSVQLAAGGTASVTQTLSYVVGSTTPGSADYVDRSTVRPCADGGEGSDPDPGDGGGTGGGDEAETPGWNVPNGTRTDSGATILNLGHVDLASLLTGKVLDTKVKDTTGSTTPVWREPEETVLQLLPSSETVVESPAQAFIGPVGQRIWQVTETQQPGLLWPGWSTEEIPAAATSGDVDWALTAVEGPGEFALYVSDPIDLGQSMVLFNTRDGLPDTTSIPKRIHAHGNWAFTAEGAYCLAFERSTTLAAGGRVTDDFVIAVAVGQVEVTKIDPSACFTADPGQPSESDTTPIPDGELTAGTAGSVQVLDGAQGFTPGQLVTVQLGRDYAGQWVSVWLHSDPRWLGWALVGESGAIRVRLPADAALGGHRIVVKDRGGHLIGWDSLSIVAAPDTTPLTSTPSAEDPTYSNAQCVAGSTILSSGHIDYASRIVGGKLESLIGDDSGGSKVYREPDGVTLWLKPSSAVTLPAGYGAIGPVGSTVWQVPQSQNGNLIWLGWNTEALNSGNASGTVSWTLNSVSGPGTVRVYTGGSFGGVNMVLNGAGSSSAIPLGVHAHANWAFSAEGAYRLTMTQSVTLVNGQRSRDTETLTIVVGNVDPATAVGGSGCGVISNAILESDDADEAEQDAEQAAAAAGQAARDILPGHRRDGGELVDPITAFIQGNPVPLLLSILGLLLLAGAAGAGAFWWRRRRAG